MTADRKPIVYVTLSKIFPPVIELLTKKCEVRQWTGDGPVPRDVLLKELAVANGLYCSLNEKIDEEVLKIATNLQVVSTMSVGVEHINIEECKKRNIAVGYTPEVLTEATAELAVGLLLCTSRHLMEARETVYNGTWAKWAPSWMCGRGLWGSTVGIIGLGRIGCSIAKKLNSFSPKEIVYYNRKPIKNDLNTFNARYVTFEELLQISDFIVISCQLTPQTKHLINKQAFEKMKPTTILVNVSRGLVIDQDALYEALKNRKIYAAGLDVTTPEPLPLDHKLLTLDNIVILPHIGSATIETRTRMSVLTAENVIAGLEKHPLPASVY